MGLMRVAQSNFQVVLFPYKYIVFLYHVLSLWYRYHILFFMYIYILYMLIYTTYILTKHCSLFHFFTSISKLRLAHWACAMGVCPLLRSSPRHASCFSSAIHLPRPMVTWPGDSDIEGVIQHVWFPQVREGNHTKFLAVRSCQIILSEFAC